MKGYEIQLVARNQGLTYRDGNRVYLFDLERGAGTWFVHVPPTGAQHELIQLSETDIATLAPRIKKFLSRVWWFGIWPVSYEVVFCGDKSLTPSFQRSAL